MFIFIHIPKVGGTSIYGWLSQAFASRLRWFSPTTLPVSCLGDDQFRSVTDIYGGHFTLLSVKEYLRPEDVLFTLIREPKLRVASFYNYVSQIDRDHPLHPEVRNRSIQDAAERCPQFRKEISDAQCWFLSGHRSHLKAIAAIEHFNIQVFHSDHLEDFACGVYEIFSSMVRAPMPRLNVAKTNYQADFSVDDWAFMEACNQEDKVLFEHFRSRRADII